MGLPYPLSSHHGERHQRRPPPTQKVAPHHDNLLKIKHLTGQRLPFLGAPVTNCKVSHPSRSTMEETEQSLSRSTHAPAHLCSGCLWVPAARCAIPRHSSMNKSFTRAVPGKNYPSSRFKASVDIFVRIRCLPSGWTKSIASSPKSTGKIAKCRSRFTWNTKSTTANT
jgi:hypothetical protein